MKKIIKEHPLRPIVLSFDLSKKALPFEITALEAYYRSHDLTYETLQNLQEHQDELFLLDAKFTDLQSDIYRTGLQVEEMRGTLAKKGEVSVHSSSEATAVKRLFQKLELELRLIEKKLNAVAQHFVKEMQWYTTWCDYIYDNESWLTDSSPGLLLDIYTQYNDVSVDIISLDRDQEEFHKTYGRVYDLHLTYQEYGKQVAFTFNSTRDDFEKLANQLESTAETLTTTGILDNNDRDPA